MNFSQYFYLIFLFISLSLTIINKEKSVNNLNNNKENINNNKENYKVKNGSVYDGDTLRIINNKGEELKIRFACVDAPERSQPLGIESRDYLKGLLAENNNEVKLNIITTDRYGRNVAILYVKNKIVQVEQVRNGWVYPYEEYARDCPVWEEIKEAEKEAINNGVNIYNEDNKNLEKPSEYRRKKRK